MLGRLDILPGYLGSFWPDIWEEYKFKFKFSILKEPMDAAPDQWSFIFHLKLIFRRIEFKLSDLSDPSMSKHWLYFYSLFVPKDLTYLQFPGWMGKRKVAFHPPKLYFIAEQMFCQAGQAVF